MAGLHQPPSVMTSRLVCVPPLVALVAAFMAAPSPAEACSPFPDPGFFPQLADGARTDVPTDGVIAFRAEAYGEFDEALALLDIEVTQDGTPVAGSIETVEIGTSEGFGTVTQIFVVWRPDAPFAGETSYVASVAVADGFDPMLPPTVTTLDITTAPGSAGPLPTLALADVELVAESTGFGPRVCCDVGNSCGFDGCEALELADRPAMRARVIVPDDPMAAQAYLRLSSGVDDALAEHGIAGLATDVSGTFQRTFDAAAGNYCFGVELVSLIDGSVQPMVSQCEAHGDLALTRGENPAFEPFLEQCLADPFWEDTGEPYVPGGSDETGGDDSGGDDSDGDDSGGSGSDDTGGLGQDVELRGCACAVQDGGTGWPAWAMFVLAGAWIRRRGPARRAQR